MAVKAVPRRRVLAIGVDGYDDRIAAPLMARGELPHLAAMQARSARFRLENASSVRPGLIWEYFASGSLPQVADKWTSVHFDPASYEVWQMPASQVPFLAQLDARTVVFDAPYVDLAKAPRVQGVVAWATHSPGLLPASQPPGLLDELNELCGRNPAGAFLYGIPWPSIEVTEQMGRVLAHTVAVRADAAVWLLRDRLPDWDLAIVVSSELHPASEGLWHGLDSAHPMHGIAASTSAAASSLARVYRAVDALVGRLAECFADTTIVVFAPEGMGPNQSDAASMVLLAELLYRNAFDKPWMCDAGDTAELATMPILGPAEGWVQAVQSVLPLPPDFRSFAAAGKQRQSLDWMPVTHYRPFWPLMPAFALPSFDEGRVRINLAGREARGTVSAADYDSVCDGIETVLRDCRDSLTGAPAVAEIVRAGAADPRDIGPTQADLTVLWSGANLGLDHPKLGRMGPLPYRRPGGHAGGHGFAWLAGAGLPAGDRGARPSCDLPPTLVELLGTLPIPGMLGRSLCQSDSA